MLSTYSVEIQSGATLAVNELGYFSASVNVAGGTFDVGNTRDRTALFLTNLTVTNDEAVNPVNPNPGMITFDMNDLCAFLDRYNVSAEYIEMIRQELDWKNVMDRVLLRKGGI